MKTRLAFQIIALSVCTITVTSCEKNSISVPQTTPSTAVDKVADSLNNQSIATAFSSYQILGNYSLRGSRTKYRGQANQNGDNIIVIYDYFGEKTIETSRADKALTCGYGEPNLTSLGWKYIIRYSPISKQILLSPNDTMAAAIKPDSFEALAAVYDLALHSFTFQTRYTDTDGNENEVIDILNKE